jgi:hypothetical protein
MPDDHLRERFLDALERMYTGFSRDDLVAFRVSRVRQVCALPTLGYSRRVPRIKTSVPRLYAVTSAQIVNGTLNVNETVKLAEQAAKTLMQPVGSQADTGEIWSDEQSSDVQADCQLVAGS